MEFYITPSFQKDKSQNRNCMKVITQMYHANEHDGPRLVFYPRPAGPDGSFVSTGACNLVYQVQIPVGTDICHRGCAFTVLQTVQRPAVYSAADGTVHYKEPWKSFEIRVGHTPGFGLPSVAILS